MPWPTPWPRRRAAAATRTSAAPRSATRAARRASFAPSGPEPRRTDMRITITGASGLIGTKLTAKLTERGDEVTKLSTRGEIATDAVNGRDAIVHLAGENVAQRWTDEARARIHDSRVNGTRALVHAINAADPRPKALISSSAVGIYGPHGAERIDEDTAPGDDFLAQVCVAW